MSDPFFHEPLRAALVGAALVVPVAVARAATVGGCAAGAVAAAWLAWAGGRPALVAFAALVVVGTWTSRLGRERKRREGVAQSDGGRRAARHVLANAGPALLAVALGEGGYVERDVAIAAACGAFAGNLADTASGELGMLFPRPPRLLLFGPIVRRGTNGGMTWPGLWCGVVSGSLVAALNADVVPVIPVVVAALVGTLTDSVLGACVEGKSGIGNETVNFTSGAVAAFCAGACV